MTCKQLIHSFYRCEGYYAALRGYGSPMHLRKAWINVPDSYYFPSCHEIAILPVGLLTIECHQTPCLLTGNIFRGREIMDHPNAIYPIWCPVISISFVLLKCILLAWEMCLKFCTTWVFIYIYIYISYIELLFKAVERYIYVLHHIGLWLKSYWFFYHIITYLLLKISRNKIFCCV